MIQLMELAQDKPFAEVQEGSVCEISIILDIEVKYRPPLDGLLLS
jgi:hypothetical protein